MLSELRIENFALIEHLQLELSAGLNVLTGETGAGKSIIIDAVSLLLGGRASAEFIRSGSERAFVEGLFLLDNSNPAAHQLMELGYELEDSTLLLTRELSAAGRNICRLQGRTVPLALYREIGAQLIDIHGQHDYQSLLRPESHVYLLDSLAEGLGEIKTAVKQSARTVQELRSHVAKLQGDERDAARREDMLKFQLEEIGSANLMEGEEQDLLQERVRLSNAERLTSLTAGAYATLFEGFERQKSAVDAVAMVVAKLKDLVAIDSTAAPMLESLEGAFYQMEEVAMELRSYRDNTIFDPARQDEVEERLALIKSLQRKYGSSIGEIIAFHKEAAAELAQLSRQEELITEFKTKLAKAEEVYSLQAASLTKARQQVATTMEASVSRELAELKMPKTRFKVNFAVRDKVHHEGQDLIEFMFSPNPGEPLKPLAKTASGGEMSRVILALKTLLAKIDPVPTLIFDEVDSGVGGEAVRKVAEKLAKIAQARQVLCVTHSPHVASFANRHFFISKDILDERTITNVKVLHKQDRKAELARMLGGSSITKVSLEHAEEMLKMANQL